MICAATATSCTWFRHDTERLFYRKGVDDLRWSIDNLPFCQDYADKITKEDLPRAFIALEPSDSFLWREGRHIGGFYDQRNDVIYYNKNHPSVIEHEATHRLFHVLDVSTACKEELAAYAVPKLRNTEDALHNVSYQLMREREVHLH